MAGRAEEEHDEKVSTVSEQDDMVKGRDLSIGSKCRFTKYVKDKEQADVMYTGGKEWRGIQPRLPSGDC